MDGTPLLVEQDRGTTVGHLDAVSRDVQLRLAVALSESGHQSLRPSFGPLLERLRDGALAVGQVAAELNVSPQAASRAALVLEQFGYVARSASTADGRSRVVGLTSRGEDLIRKAGDTFVDCEHAYDELLGRAVISPMRRDLDELRMGLELVTRPDPDAPLRTPHSIGSVILIALCAKREVVSAANRRGHRKVRRSHIEVLTTIGRDGARVSDIARELGVTRQAVSATVQELGGLGYVRRRPDETDKRAVLTAPSVEGMELLDHVAAAAGAFEARCHGLLGARRWTRFARDLAELAEAVAGDAGTLPPRSARLVGSDPSSDLVSLAQSLRTQLGPRRSARLGVLLVTQRPRSTAASSERTSSRRTEPTPRDG